MLHTLLKELTRKSNISSEGNQRKLTVSRTVYASGTPFLIEIEVEFEEEAVIPVDYNPSKV